MAVYAKWNYVNNYFFASMCYLCARAGYGGAGVKGNYNVTLSFCRFG